MKNNRNINALNLILLMILSLTFISTAQAQYFQFRIGSQETLESQRGLFVMKGDKIDKVDKIVADGGTLSIKGKGDKIDRKDKFVANGGTLSISTNEAMLCERNTCVFKIGFIISRKFHIEPKMKIDVVLSAQQQDYAYVKQNDQGLEQVYDLIYFPELSKIQSKILPLRLNVGKNTVYLNLNRYLTVGEEYSQDSVKVTINVIRN